MEARTRQKLHRGQNDPPRNVPTGSKKAHRRQPPGRTFRFRPASEKAVGSATLSVAGAPLPQPLRQFGDDSEELRGDDDDDDCFGQLHDTSPHDGDLVMVAGRVK